MADNSEPNDEVLPPLPFAVSIDVTPPPAPPAPTVIGTT
jgi:hypothetical protein